MKNNNAFLKILCLITTIIMLALAMCACSKEENPSDEISLLPAFDRDSYFYGGGELASEVGIKDDWRDEGITIDWTVNTAKALQTQSQRVWMHFNTVIKRAEKSNEISLIRSECDRYHEYFAKLKAAGVKRIIVMNHHYIYPYGFVAETGMAVPDPWEDKEIYAEWIQLYYECYKLVAEEFPEISFWECGNEFDLDSFMHKSNYKTDEENSHFAQDDAAFITADLCYAARKAVKSVRSTNFIVLPGMSQFAKTLFFDSIYNSIESKKLPTLEDYCVTNPDEYFDIIAWHCYPINSKSGIDYDASIEEFKERCFDMYEVAKTHGDGEKRVWITEIGLSEVMFSGMSDTSAETTARYSVKIVKMVYDNLPFVETIFWFRYSCLYSRHVSELEDNFGLFFSPDDPVNRGKPKPVAIAMYKFRFGDNADLSPLYWCSDKYGVQR